MSYRQQHHERLVAQSREAFQLHVIRKRSEGRWLLQRRHDDGGWDSVYWAEIISLHGGGLFVGGDIDHVLFGYYSDKSGNHEAKVRWMGEHNDIRYYVRQKAAIGTGHQLIDVYDKDAARQTLQEHLDEAIAEAEYFNFNDPDEDTLAGKLAIALDEYGWDAAPFEDGKEALCAYLHRKLGSDWYCDMGYNLGDVLAPRVYYAHAALRRLCELLDAERAEAEAS